MWYALADRLGMSLQRCQQETTSSQFVEWQEYIAWKTEQTEHEDYYLAQIAAEIRRGNVRKPNSVKLDHFLLKLTMRTKTIRPNLLTEEQKASRVANSKAFWSAIAGATPQRPQRTEK